MVQKTIMVPLVMYFYKNLQKKISKIWLVENYHVIKYFMKCYDESYDTKKNTIILHFWHAEN